MKKLLFVITVALCACSAPKEECRYADGLAIYFRNVLKIDMASVREGRFYIVPVEGCSTCVLSNLSMLNSLEEFDALSVVLVGSPIDSTTQALVALLQQKAQTFEDRSRQIYQYETGFSKPLFIELHDGRCYNAITVTDDLVSTMPAQLNNEVPD